MAADERGPDWDPITGNRTWNDVKDQQFTGLSGLFGAATTSRDDPPSPAALRDLIAAAISARIKQSVILPPTPGMLGQPFAATEYDLADAIIEAVSAEQLYPTVRIYEQTVTDLRQQRERAEEAERTVDRVRDLLATSEPQPLKEADLMPLLTAWEHRRRQNNDGIKILLHPYPNCPTCGSAVHEAMARKKSDPFSDNLIAFQPCGHLFTLTDHAIAQHYDRVMDVVDQLESRTT